MKMTKGKGTGAALLKREGTLRKKKPCKIFHLFLYIQISSFILIKKMSLDGWPSLFFLNNSGLVVLFEKQGQQGNQISMQSCDMLLCSAPKTAGSNLLIN